MALADTANLAVKITLDDRGFTGPLNKIQRNLGGLNKGFGRVGKGVGQLGAGFARVGAIAAGAAAVGLAAVAREGIKWESALAGVNKTMDLTPTELQTIGTEIRKLATTIPIGADAIAGLAEQAGALGIAKEDVVEFARVAATIGVTTNVSADEAASALGTLASVLGLTGDEFERLASTLVDLGNKGSSTEDSILAIAKRSAAAGSTIGLTTEQILGFSAAAANALGPGAEEAGGSALQKFFIETLKFVREGSKSLKDFAKDGQLTANELEAIGNTGLGTMAKTAGVAADAFAELYKTDPGAALEQFVVGLSKVGKGKRLDILDSLGFSDIRITRLLLGMAKAESKTKDIQGTISDSLNVSAEAWAANTAAAAEADKRYATVASKLELLKNQAIESALLIGEGFLPALGRMSDKLKAILTDDAQRQTFIDFGKDIGTIIDGIDFNKVLGAAKTFVGVVKSIWSVLRLIPIEISAAVAGFALLNKASGGLIGAGVGNIFGGLLETLTRSLGARAPGGLGKLFTQPVFVTNWPVGFGGPIPPGGKPGAPGVVPTKGAGVLNNIFKGLGVLFLADLASQLEPELEKIAREMGTGIETAVESQFNIQLPEINSHDLEWPFGPKNTPTILPEIFGDNGLLGGTPRDSTIQPLKPGEKASTPGSRPSYSYPTSPADMKLLEKSKEQAAKLTAVNVGVAAVSAAVKAARMDAAAKANRQAQLQAATRAAAVASKIAQIAAGRSDTARMISAIHAARPIVSVVVNAATNYTTTVKTGTTSTKREADINKANRATEGM